MYFPIRLRFTVPGGHLRYANVPPAWPPSITRPRTAPTARRLRTSYQLSLPQSLHSSPLLVFPESSTTLVELVLPYLTLTLALLCYFHPPTLYLSGQFQPGCVRLLTLSFLQLKDMASLRFILDTDDDPSDRQDPRSIQKDKDAATVRSRSQDPSTSARASHASSSNRVAESNLRLAAAAAAAALSNQQDPSSNRVNPTSAAEDLSESNPSLAAAAASSTGQRSTSPSRVVPTFPGEDPTSSSPRSTRVRRHSAASDDSMDQAGYGSAASSSSRGGGRHPPRTPMRPMPSAPGVDGPVKLTPVTRRISRAKKGVPVHVCETCRPPKVSRFTASPQLNLVWLSWS